MWFQNGDALKTEAVPLLATLRAPNKRARKVFGGFLVLCLVAALGAAAASGRLSTSRVAVPLELDSGDGVPDETDSLKTFDICNHLSYVPLVSNYYVHCENCAGESRNIQRVYDYLIAKGSVDNLKPYSEWTAYDYLIAERSVDNNLKPYSEWTAGENILNVCVDDDLAKKLGECCVYYLNCGPPKRFRPGKCAYGAVKDYSCSGTGYSCAQRR
mmetsp:Transcript_25984/g.79933  ORF Transcript_25984/g.79933 Transcript_25984/m.79933 type:complete len:214 (+) Transcript_25984:303-944(+)